jgi:hypothetical protein
MIDIEKINTPIFGRLYEMCGEFVTNINSDNKKNYRLIGGEKHESL